MYYQRLSDEEIMSGFREGDADIIREYFYGYCRVGYNIFDQRYQLRGKENLDFMSLAHQYALYLMEHGWKPLEDHSPNISLKTWLINGFRYVVLDALKWYRKEYGSITFEDYLRSFDVSDDLRLQFNRIVEDLCDHAPLNRQERLIINMTFPKKTTPAVCSAAWSATISTTPFLRWSPLSRLITPSLTRNYRSSNDWSKKRNKVISYKSQITNHKSKVNVQAGRSRNYSAVERFFAALLYAVSA